MLKGKADIASDLVVSFTWEADMLSWSWSCSGLFSQGTIRWRVKSAFWGCAFKGIHTVPSSISTTLTGRRTWKRPLFPVLCHRRVRNNKLLHGDHTGSFFFLFSGAFSFHRRPQTPRAMRTCAALLNPQPQQSTPLSTLNKACPTLKMHSGALLLIPGLTWASPGAPH